MSVNTLGPQHAVWKDRLSWAVQPVNRAVPVFVSSYLPTTCGLATFTHDLADAVDKAAGEPVSNVVAIRKDPHVLPYTSRVRYSINNGDRQAYRRAALFCNRHSWDLVSIQHEYGLYTGEWGESILDFARACVKPLVTTLHTLSLNPEPKARQVVQELSALSRRVIVMAGTAVRILSEVYGVDPEKVAFIPHGVHNVVPYDPRTLRRKVGVEDGPVMVTFGLLSPGKGIEYMLDALPAIVHRHPRAIYLIVGATHPVVKSNQGELYREQLVKRAKQLGVWENVRFVDRFLSLDEVLLYVSSADVYVTPYTGRDQIVSGTLAYALSAGKAIVSTPYLYAEEMAARGALLLADFTSGESLAREAIRILETPSLRKRLENRAWEIGRQMVWDSVGKQYYALFREEAEQERRKLGARWQQYANTTCCQAMAEATYANVFGNKNT